MSCIVTSVQRNGMYQLKVYKLAILRKWKISKCFIILALDKSEQSTSRSDRFICTKVRSYPLNWKLSGSKTHLDLLRRHKFLAPTGIWTPIVQAIAYSLYLPVYEIIVIVKKYIHTYIHTHTYIRTYIYNTYLRVEQIHRS